MPSTFKSECCEQIATSRRVAALPMKTLQLRFLAVEENGLTLDLPPTLHAHPISGSVPDMHIHPGGKLRYFSPLLFRESHKERRTQWQNGGGFRRPPTVSPA
jgi:hypothetical protein